jgi:hypothetical protein
LNPAVFCRDPSRLAAFSDTAALVCQLRKLAAGRITRVDQLEQPMFGWRSAVNGEFKRGAERFRTRSGNCPSL